MWAFGLRRPVALPSPKIIIYDKQQKEWQGGLGQDGPDIYDAAVDNGSHGLVVNAWDSYGNFYQAKETFYVTGLGFRSAPLQAPRESTSVCLPSMQFFLPASSSVPPQKGRAP